MKRRARTTLQELVAEFAQLQTQVLDSLHRSYTTIRDTQNFQWPARVDLSVDGVSWHGSRHGIGYRFEDTDGRVVEAHDSIQRPPYPIDAFRLEQYAESLGIEILDVDNVSFSADDTLAFERCLPMLEVLGRIRLVETPRSGGLNRYLVT